MAAAAQNLIKQKKNIERKISFLFRLVSMLSVVKTKRLKNKTFICYLFARGYRNRALNKLTYIFISTYICEYNFRFNLLL